MTETKKAIHPSLERLLEVAAEVKRTKGPAAIAAALNESDQSVTNWKSRGVSKAAALKAQDIYGCSSNWILHGREPKYIHLHDPAPTAQPKFEDNVAHYMWPFKSITPAEYNQVLTSEDRTLIESTAVGLFNARTSGSKQAEPAKIHR